MKSWLSELGLTGAGPVRRGPYPGNVGLAFGDGAPVSDRTDPIQKHGLDKARKGGKNESITAF